jgi:hypothetical protein
MTLTLTWNTIITGAAVLAAAAAVISQFAKGVRWVDRQQKQDDHIKSIEDEQTLIVYALLACLKGLREQGCDGPVTEAIDKVEEHINIKAHGG